MCSFFFILKLFIEKRDFLSVSEKKENTYVEHSNVRSELVSESFRRISNFGASRNISILRFDENDDDDPRIMRRERERRRERDIAIFTYRFIFLIFETVQMI